MPRHITKCPCVLSPRTNGTNDWLGSVVIPIGEMNASNGEERWYPLARDSAHVKNEYGQKGKDPQGEIKIKCQFLNTVSQPATASQPAQQHCTPLCVRLSHCVAASASTMDWHYSRRPAGERARAASQCNA
jgi:hypothetical protein